MYSDFKYRVGSLFYIPAVNATAADKIVNGLFDGLTSTCFCLEDAICDDALEMAEDMLLESLKKISIMPSDCRPLIFIRIRNPEHLIHMHEKLEPVHDVITGYVLPKFDTTNSKHYLNIMTRINHQAGRKFYAMPVLESRLIADLKTRMDTLYELKNDIDAVRDIILNVRVGGNDFCNLFGLRRNIHQTIYDIGVVRNILVDIINVFSFDYIVSGPVWEYFGKDTNDDWAVGLRKEIELGALNGFTGKTAIHPSQLPIIKECLQVTRSDYDDAVSILNWDSNTFGVAKTKTSRMNEVKCHRKWAKRIKAMGDIYGIREGM